MPFIANTPESLIGRTDSKNPSTTCRGITSSGRPCRRPIAAPDPTLTATSRPRLGRLRVDDPRDEKLYCWQHKEQASQSARSSPGPTKSTTPILEERTSLDTLADRLGLLEVSEKPHKARYDGQPGAYRGGGDANRPSKTVRSKKNRELLFCCFRIPIEETAPPPRPKPRPGPRPASAPAKQGTSPQPGPTTPSRPRPSLTPQSASSGRPRKSSAQSVSSQTAQYFSLIPPDASPQTASQLMAELAKPFSQMDEPGYIYMFWLTPESQKSNPPTDAARSMLAPPAPTRPGGGRRPSDVLASFAAATSDEPSNARGGSSGASGGRKNTILLKIGRATNVQRRLNEWTRQCGYDLSLIRYYPYVSSSSPGPVTVPRKVPHSHKVERLVHIELGGLGLRLSDRRKCDACGRDHREWFEVEASRKGVMQVDAAIRRWVDWDEGR